VCQNVSVKWVQQGRQGQEEVGQARSEHINLELINEQNNAVVLEIEEDQGRPSSAGEAQGLEVAQDVQGGLSVCKGEPGGGEQPC
jgi:hypothetical protein